MFDKILIANRGEIACRIIKTARRLGIETVAIYSTADSESLHVKRADQAFCVGLPAASASYLNIDAIINAAIISGAQAIHPGYGFLSENPAFARACAKANIVFIGPSINAMEIMGSKQLAKQLLETTEVPLTPGYHGADQSDARLRIESERLGFPVLLKAANGGGGKGMRAVQHINEFEQALAGARRESRAYFADDTMLIEKLVSNPRHVEIQIMADNHGNIVHLFERDCSIQRRHQKIIEEAPAPNLSDRMRDDLASAAIAVARTIDYQGAGTVEFLVDGDTHFYFMEMNTRLQVEHPVTEMITGLDLVEWQLRIAANETLPNTQAEISAHGHAIECRVYAEDPSHDFMPSIGQLSLLQEPKGAGIRIDSGVTQGSIISMHYDPMISKLIAWGNTRTQAQQRLQQALKQYYIGGVKTNIPFLEAILKHPHFVNAELSTDFLSKACIEMPAPDLHLALHMAACSDYLTAQLNDDPLHKDAFAWQMHLQSHWSIIYIIQDVQYTVHILPINLNRVTIESDNRCITWQVKQTGNTIELNDEHQYHQALVETANDTLVFHTQSGPITVKRFDWQHTVIDNTTTSGQLTAPMPATVVAILKNRGDKINAGECLMVLEAMKMEHTILAPANGILIDIFYDIGAQVNEGAQLVAMEIDK